MNEKLSDPLLTTLEAGELLRLEPREPGAMVKAVRRLCLERGLCPVRGLGMQDKFLLSELERFVASCQLPPSEKT